MDRKRTNGAPTIACIGPRRGWPDAHGGGMLRVGVESRKGIEMKDFLLSAACNGRRPHGVGSGRRVARPRLMQKLMGERGVARFLVAPTGFGKSSLALQYAEEIMGLTHVWWIDADDPCFLRDLDNGRIRETVSGLAGEGQLAVFDDVPYLDEERSQAFSGIVDDLLERGWEVIAATCPPYDSFSERQSDRVYVGASDFLLDDAELAAYEHAAPAADLRDSERIGALVWGGARETDAFLKGVAMDGMPAEMQLAVFVMLVLQDGVFEDVAMFAKPLKQDVRSFLGAGFPYAGMDLTDECFSSCRLSIAQLVEVFGSRLDRLAAASVHANKDVLVMRLAGELMRKGRHARACDLVSVACGRRRRSVWLEEHQDALFTTCSLVEAQRVFASLGEHPVKLKPAILVHAALRCALLGDVCRAVELAARVLGQSSADRECKMAAALLCHLDAGGRYFRKGRDHLVASKIVSSAGSLDADDAVAALAAPSESQGCGHGGGATKGAACLDPRQRVVLYALAVVLSVPGGESDSPELRRAACSIIERLSSFGSEPDLAEALLFTAVSSARAMAADPSCLPLLSPARIEKIDELMDRLNAQRHMGEAKRPDSSRISGTGVFLPDPGNCGNEGFERLPGHAGCGSSGIILPGAPECRSGFIEAPAFANELIPPLYVRLFGGMEVWMGDRQIDPRSFTKQKAKTLLAVLVLHGAQEVPRRRVMDIMWPKLVGDSAINNFYSMWSVLRHALALEDGKCPYLVKQQASCMLDRRYVTSDVDRFDEFCRKLLFEKPDASEWSEIYMAMSRMYAGDLLPSEMKNEYIMAMRTQLRGRLVDALVAAGGNLLDEGEPQVALWFIRSAIDHDDGREDVYRTLIRAQIMTGQRAAAIESYLHCRKVLHERYGMEVSRETQALYDSLVMVGA